MSKEATFTLEEEGLTRTYAGLLDDVMIRYGEGRELLSEEFFNKMIVKNLLFGSGIYLNDGYLVNHPIARRYLANPDSLLRVMLSTGFIRILSREKDADLLSKMPEKMAASGNDEFIRLINSREWIERTGPAFRQVAAASFFNGTVRAWPRFDMSAGFCDLLDRVFAATPEKVGLVGMTQGDLRHIEDKFKAMDPRVSNPRHKAEVAGREVFQADEAQFQQRMAAWMDIANQAYHYNFGLTLTAEEDNPVAAETTVGLAFDELLKTRHVERGQLEDVPLIQFPANIPLDEGELFLPFIRPDHPVSTAKRHYMEALNLLIGSNATNIPALRQDVNAATAGYIARMREYFEPRFGRIAIESAFDGAITLGLTSSGGPTMATAAPNAQLAVAVQRLSNSQRRAFLLERFQLVDATASFELDPARTITLGDIRSQLASLAFDEEGARAFAANLPRFS